MVVGFVQVEVTVFVVFFVVVLVPGGGRCSNFAQMSLLIEEYLENVLIKAATSPLVQQLLVCFSTESAGGRLDALVVKQRDSSENRMPNFKALAGECIMKGFKQKKIADEKIGACAGRSQLPYNIFYSPVPDSSRRMICLPCMIVVYCPVRQTLILNSAGS
jgi:hypothetical protein